MGCHCGAATQRAGVNCRALCVHRAAATPASRCTFHRNYVCPFVPTHNGRSGLAGRGPPNLPRPVSLSHPMKDVSERRTSLEIVYAAWHVQQCDVCMHCHSIWRTDCDNAHLMALDIKALLLSCQPVDGSFICFM